TDMDVLLVLQYAEKMRKMDLEKLEIETLSGIDRYVNDVSYWLVDEEGMQEQVDRILRRIKPEENRDIRVQVLNGNGRSGDASELAAELRRYGFNVVAVGNADHFDYKENLLIPHSEESSVVRQVARVVGIYCVGQDEDFAENRDERADVTIIVGKNYK
ncbi:MAG: LytR C-terminal domain-containing protein, partial [Firmicutes bacterium]|nr:LytR C-terminal domain-containing protein [Bacillota bacterium]